MRSIGTILVIALAAGCNNGAVQNGGAPAAPDSFTVALATSKGMMELMVHRDWAPVGVDRFYYLLQNDFYDQARFFRVVPHFVAQFGMPADPSFTQRYAKDPIPDDRPRHSNLRGTVSFAHAGPGTRGSQMFINLKDNLKLDSGMVPFAPIGEIRSGGSAIDSLNGEYNNPAGGPDQGMIGALGNSYLNSTFPRLDYITTARITREWKPAGR
ncbi:MAG TPA: peptidylprolyl isomerase [Gemmatimonadales bacterium]|jgi:peptidyl-prolyl cis-trans isomerase A (cyclophilin A)